MSLERLHQALEGVEQQLDGEVDVRRPGAVLRSQPKLAFTITIAGSTTMNYRIVEKDAFTLSQLAKVVTNLRPSDS